MVSTRDQERREKDKSKIETKIDCRLHYNGLKTRRRPKTCKYPKSSSRKTDPYYFDRIFSSSWATLSPTSFVPLLPPMSFVETPLSIVILTASSIAAASSDRLKEYKSIMAMDSIEATGLMTPLPAMSGAEPTHRKTCQSDLGKS